MKKRLLIAMLAMVTVLSGCSAAQPAADAADSQVASSDAEGTDEASADNKEADQADATNDAEIDDNSSDIEEAIAVYESEIKRIYYEDGREDDPSNNNYYDEYYKLVLKDDKEANFIEKVFYPYNASTINEYNGSYEKKGDRIQFSYDTSGGYYAIKLDGDVISKVEYQFEESDVYESAVGEYTCDSEDMGSLKLIVDEDKTIKVSDENNNTYYGLLSYYDGRYEVYLYEDAEMSSDALYDWFLTFNGDTFEYEDYRIATYGKFEGEYELTGDLGIIKLVVAKDGEVSAEAKVNGEKRKFNGSIYVDDDEISGAWLYNDDGYSMDLLIVEIGGGELNYSGTLTMPLSAG